MTDNRRTTRMGNSKRADPAELAQAHKAAQEQMKQEAAARREAAEAKEADGKPSKR